MHLQTYSFPSSHAYVAALVGGYLATLALQHAHALLVVLLVAIIAAIGASRIYLGAHYPSDVIAGWLLGCFLLTLVLIVA